MSRKSHWIWNLSTTLVLVASHTTMQKNSWERPDYGLRSYSSYTREEARELDSTPRPKPLLSSIEDGIPNLILFWGVFSAPGLSWISSNRWGSVTGVITGLFICWLGYYWGQIIPVRNRIIRKGPGIVGVMLVVNSIIISILPVQLLLIVSYILTPFGIWRLCAKEEKTT